MARSWGELVDAAKLELLLSNRDLAKLTGAALRSLERHGLQDREHVLKLIRAVFPRNRGLAGELAIAVGTTLDALNLKQAVLTDADKASQILLHCAIALQIRPDLLRPAVTAAFKEAASLGISASAVASELAKAGDSPSP